MGRGQSGLRQSQGGEFLNSAIAQAQAGALNTSYEDVLDIQDTTYGLDVTRLTQTERNTLASDVYNGVVTSGSTSKNSMKTVDDINNNTGVVKINISQFTSSELIDVIKASYKISSTSSLIAMQDALKLLSYYNQV